MKRALPIALIAILGLAAAAAYYQQRDTANQAPTTTLTLYGNVDIRQVQLAFNGADRIERMLVKEGEHVRKGQLLATLDTQRLRHNADALQAQLAAQRQVIARLKAGNRPEEIRKARADEQAAAIEAENTARTYRRLKDLVARKYVAQQQADDAGAAAEAARAKFEAAKQARRIMELGARKEDIAAAEDTLRAEEAALALARTQLADTSLYAPACM